MEPNEALLKAGQILDEERADPTVGYTPNEKGISAKHADPFAAKLLQALALSGDQRLDQIRSQRPRRVEENPRAWTLKSVNFDLLCALHAQIVSDSRPAFVTGILQRMASAACGRARRATYQPRWHGFVSELPLVAEFCVRNGATQAFLGALCQIEPAPGQAVLLLHLEELIALNFTVLSDAEYVQLELCVKEVGDRAKGQFRQHREGQHPTRLWAGESVAIRALLHEIGQAADGILEESRKARYLYLKGSLLDGLNIEINQDKDAVQSYLQGLGFTKTLARSLDEAERLYHEGGDAFSLKAGMGHLRSFLEDLHKEAILILQVRVGGAAPANWGSGLVYLRKNEVLSEAEEKFAAGLYTIISEQAVHALVTEREYTRLFRNVVIEYALLLLRKLDKLGLKRVDL